MCTQNENTPAQLEETNADIEVIGVNSSHQVSYIISLLTDTPQKTMTVLLLKLQEALKSVLLQAQTSL